MEENKNLLLKGAMTYGLAMGIYWVVKYIFFIFSVSVPSLSLVYWLLTLAVPFIAYYMTKRYRHDIGGRISFFHAWRFGTMLYFFAALIVSLEYFVFYQFIAPPDFVANAIGQLTTALKDSQVSWICSTRSAIFASRQSIWPYKEYLITYFTASYFLYR